MKKHQTKLILYLAAGALLLGGFSLGAANTNQWETSAAFGLALTRGNSETLLGNLTVNSSRKWPRDEVLLGASATYGQQTIEVTEPNGRERDRDETTTANAQGFGQYNHLFTDQFYGGMRLAALHDRIADVKYRITVSPLAGYYVIKNPKTKLAFEGGPSFVFERLGQEKAGQDGEHSDKEEYVALRLAERFEHKFSDKSKMWQTVEYLPQIDRWGNYLLIFEIGAEATLTERLSLRGVLQDIYDGEPADGRKNNDIKLITSLVYKF